MNGYDVFFLMELAFTIGAGVFTLVQVWKVRRGRKR